MCGLLTNRRYENIGGNYKIEMTNIIRISKSYNMKHLNLGTKTRFETLRHSVVLSFETFHLEYEQSSHINIIRPGNWTWSNNGKFRNRNKILTIVNVTIYLLQGK